jgi:hypothetical protein
LRGEIIRRSRGAPSCADASVFGLRVTTGRLMISFAGTAMRRDLLLSLSANSGAAATGDGLISGKPERAPLLIQSESSRVGATGRTPERFPRANPSAGRIVTP